MLKVCRFRCFRPCSKRRDGKSRDAYTCSAKLLCKLPLEAILLESYLKYTPLSEVNRLPPATKSLHSTPPPPTPVRFKKTHGSSSNIILTVRSCVFCNIVTGRPPKPDETPILMHAYPRGASILDRTPFPSPPLEVKSPPSEALCSRHVFLSAVFSLLCSEHAIIVAYWRTGNILILPVLPRVFFSQVTNVLPNA